MVQPTKVCRQLERGNGESVWETDINRMADYARWLGDPTRSEFTVSLPDVIAGEKIFRDIKCNTCHVIDKIPITDPNDTMLPPVFRDRLADITITPPAHPFLSYIGTDLLMHDMGYLSQVGTISTRQLKRHEKRSRSSNSRTTCRRFARRR